MMQTGEARRWLASHYEATDAVTDAEAAEALRLCKGVHDALRAVDAATPKEVPARIDASKRAYDLWHDYVRQLGLTDRRVATHAK